MLRWGIKEKIKMKDFDPIKQNPDQVKIVNEAKVAYEKKFI
jgi:hypothetical protein